MLRLCRYSLALLACSPLWLVGQLGAWEVVRLALVAAGLGLLLWGGRGAPAHVLALAYAFSLAHLEWVYAGGFALRLGVNALIAAALAGAVGAGLLRGPLSRGEKWVAGAAVAMVGLQVPGLFDPHGYGGFAQFGPAVLLVVDCVVVFFLVSRLLQTAAGPVIGRRLLLAACAPLAVAGLAGCAGIGGEFYYGGRALQGFAAGDYGASRRYLARMGQNGAAEYALDAMIGRAGQADQPATAYEAVGDMAAGRGAWPLAAVAYGAAGAGGTGGASLQARLAGALFETGDQERALRAWGEAGFDDPESACGYAVALARMGRWDEASVAFTSAADAGALEALDRRGPVFAGRLSDVAPPAVLGCLKRLTLFEAAQLLGRRGWAVLHPGQEIGATGVVAPVDIAAFSGGGGQYDLERIVVAGEQVSPRKRGYNIIVLNERTGAVERRVNFDTWDKRDDAARMIRFLSGVPRGRIVVGTANDEASTALTGLARSALRRFGVRRFPDMWWSHAFIGVAGGQAGLEGLALGPISVGAVTANVAPSTAADQALLTALLRERAAAATGGVALYLAGLEPESAVVAAVAR